MSRSLRVDPKYIQKVKLALKRNGYPSQRKFAEDIGPSLSTVKNFLKGKPVDYENFREICERLGLDWQAITYIDVGVEQEEAIAKPYQESVESDAGSIEDRIFKATDQLNPERPVFSRISGIQALGEIAKDSPRYHWQIMEVLAAFVRTNAPRKEEGEEERSLKLHEDIQAALTVIVQRDWNLPIQALDLSNTDLRGANLNRANLQGVNLDGANLQEIRLIAANLRRATFKRANLQRAIMHKANLARANFTEANLQGADLDMTELEEAELWSTNLQGTRLRAAYLQRAKFIEANLQGAFLSDNDWQGVVLSGVNLRGAVLKRAKNLESRELEGTYGDSKAASSLPENVKVPEHWMQST